MPKTPSSWPDDVLPCDPRLPAEALAYRRSEGLTSDLLLGSINITAWLFRDRNGQTNVKGNPNVTIKEIVKEFGRAETPDAEVGLHSEMLAAKWFRQQRGLQVLQVFSERIPPCPAMCAPMLKHYYPGIAWYYYYNPRSLKNEQGGIVRRAAAVLKPAYGI